MYSRAQPKFSTELSKISARHTHLMRLTIPHCPALLPKTACSPWPPTTPGYVWHTLLFTGHTIRSCRWVKSARLLRVSHPLQVTSARSNKGVQKTSHYGRAFNLRAIQKRTLWASFYFNFASLSVNSTPLSWSTKQSSQHFDESFCSSSLFWLNHCLLIRLLAKSRDPWRAPM